jgi:hypothetical protein
VKALPYFLLALLRVHDPGAGLPWWLVPQVLSVAAGQHGDPVALLVLPETNHRRVFQYGPSVRVAFAFVRLLG